MVDAQPALTLVGRIEARTSVVDDDHTAREPTSSAALAPAGRLTRSLLAPVLFQAAST